MRGKGGKSGAQRKGLRGRSEVRRRGEDLEKGGK